MAGIHTRGNLPETSIFAHLVGKSNLAYSRRTWSSSYPEAETSFWELAIYICIKVPDATVCSAWFPMLAVGYCSLTSQENNSFVDDSARDMIVCIVRGDFKNNHKNSEQLMTCIIDRVYYIIYDNSCPASLTEASVAHRRMCKQMITISVRCWKRAPAAMSFVVTICDSSQGFGNFLPPDDRPPSFDLQSQGMVILPAGWSFIYLLCVSMCARARVL